MNNSVRYYTEIAAHNRVHQTFIEVRTVRQLNLCFSCVICWPPRDTTERFDNFWNWFSEVHNVANFTSHAQDIFEQFIDPRYWINNSAQDIQQLLWRFVFSFRYIT